MNFEKVLREADDRLSGARGMIIQMIVKRRVWRSHVREVRMRLMAVHKILGEIDERTDQS